MVKQSISYKKPKVIEPVLDHNGLQFIEPTKETKLKEQDIFIGKYLELKKKKEPKPKVKNVVSRKKVLKVELTKSNDIDLNSVENVMKEVCSV